MNTGAVGRIHQLPPEIAAKLRAGEVVSKPFSAIKELMENSLDAGCTTLKIDVSGYGFKQITIADDGCGINKDDMILLCECHATSKLKSIEDLLDIRTFGFRGEALSSISNVAHVSVITQTADSPCAYKANYHMQKMRETSPQAVAGKKGTTIIIQDLFFTVPAKRKTFTKPKDDFGEIKDVVGCYALHYPKVSFVLKQAEAKVAEINTPVGGTTLANITALHGRHVTESLLPVSLNADFASLQVEGFISNGNYAGAKSQYIFFVNHRLVEIASFKAATEQAYASTFPKHGKMHPFVYLSVTVAPQNVDVNVDCAKSRVKVLHDTRVAEALNVRITTMLKEWEKTRSDLEREKEVELLKEREAKQVKKKAATANAQRELVPASAAKPSPRKQGHPLALPIWATLAQNGSLAAGKVLQNNVFIGVVDPLHSLIVSNQNVVYSVNHTGVFELIATQYVLRQLGALATSSVPLAQPLPLVDLFMVALESPRSGYDASADGPAAVRVLEMVQFLVEKAPWLQTWFGLEIEASTHRLLKVPRDPLGNVPELSALPLMLLSLCYDVNWGPLCEDPESEAAASQVIYECARVALGPWMAPGLDRFCPQPIALETCAVEEHEAVSSQSPPSSVSACKSISPAQCLWKAAELGSEYFVWLKNGGVMARVYFVMRAPELFAQLERLSTEGDERVFQAIVHPARRIKFVATLALGTVMELSRRDHIRKLQAIATAQWIHENGGETLNLDALEAGWNVLASEDCSHVMSVNGYMVFDDVRMLHGFVGRCHERLFQSHWDMCRFPFFQRVKELSDLPIAFAKHGKFLMRPLYGPPEDNIKVFLRCLPHMLLQEDSLQEERDPKSRAMMPVDARSSGPTLSMHNVGFYKYYAEKMRSGSEGLLKMTEESSAPVVSSLDEVKRLRVSAIESGNLEALKRLVARGNVDLRITADGKTAYKLAKELGRDEMARWLATQGARLDDEEIGRLVAMSLNDKSPASQIQEALVRGSNFFDKGNCALALPPLVEAHKLQVSFLGPKHPDVQRTLVLLARSHQKLGQLEDALRYYDLCRKMQLDVLGPKSPVYLGTLKAISALYFDKGHLKEAIATLEPCVAGFREVLGTHATDTVQATKTLEDYKRASYQQPIVAAKKVGRNDPCSCGSGKKSKKCHPPQTK